MKLSRRALIHNDTSCVLGARNFSWKYCETRETSRVPRRSRPSRKAKQISFTALMPQQRRGLLRSKGFGLGKTVFETRRKTIYSERGWKRFLSRTPRDATNGCNNCSKLKPHPLRVSVPRWRCSSQITFLCHISFFVFPAASFTL